MPPKKNALWTCNYCGKTFRSRVHLELHLNWHLEKPFQCDTCPKKFTIAESLREHMLIVHHGWRPWESQEFSKPNTDSKLHKSVHDAGKSMDCEKGEGSYNPVTTKASDSTTGGSIQPEAPLDLSTNPNRGASTCKRTRSLPSESVLYKLLKKPLAYKISQASSPHNEHLQLHKLVKHARKSLDCIIGELNSKLKIVEASTSLSATRGSTHYQTRFRSSSNRNRGVSTFKHRKSLTSESFHCKHCRVWFRQRKYLNRHVLKHRGHL